MSLVITKVDIYKCPIKLKEPFVISLGPMECAQNIVVVIHTNGGILGFGECSPFMTINGESMDTCFVVAQYISKVLKGKDPTNIEACHKEMDQLIYGNSSIKSAFDMALYDIAAKEAGMPLYAFLGGKNNKTLQIDYTISLSTPEKMANDALEVAKRGFEIIKVKLGHSVEQDVESIRRIREKIGSKLPLRLDANQGWSVSEAEQILNALAPFNIQHCEEPIPRWDFMELPELCSKSPIPIMADETCCDHHDAKRLIQLKACDLINIKLSKSSGIFKALKIVEYAKAGGIKIQVGGFLETRLGFTASAHLALASEQIEYFDFDTPLMMEADPVLGGITYEERGIVKIPETPGLGATIDPDYLQNLEYISV